MLLSHFEPPTKQQERWKEELNTEIAIDFWQYYIPRIGTKLLFFVSLQKLHSWVSFNLHLNRREIVHKILCNILHWKAVNWLVFLYNKKKTKCNVELPISAQHIILGSDMLDYSINLFIVLIQYYIYSCRFSGQKPCVSGVINILEKKLWRNGKILR
jgi:hypothetical protein